MQNVLKEKLVGGKTVYGTFLWSASPCIAECLGYSGLDYVVLDAEHSPISAESVADLIRAIKLHGLTPVVRTQDSSRSSVLRMLDLGAEALIIPNIHSLEEVRTVVDFAKYPNIGRRGFAQCRAAGYGFEAYASNLEEYLRTSNEQTLLLPMCETVSLLKHIEEAVALDGVDGIFVGPYDLSLDMGIPGQFSHPAFVTALNRIVVACDKVHKYSMIFSSSSNAAKTHASMGYQALTLGIDTQTVIQAYRSELNQAQV